MLTTFIKTSLVAAAALALSAVTASAVTYGFSATGGNGTYKNLDGGAFDLAFTLHSNNNGKKNKDTYFYGVTGANETITVTGYWTFSTQDKRNASKDPLGYFINGDYFALSYPKKAPGIEDGTFSFTVAANSYFGWDLFSTDGKKGRSTATIYADITPAAVPLPAGGLMLVGAVAGLAVCGPRRRA